MVNRGNDMDSAPALYTCRKTFIARATERLGLYPSDFPAAMEQRKSGEETAASSQAAGVLLPLCFRSVHPDSIHGEYVFLLIKRSALVPQPGDLSCPGGMLHPLVDRLFRPFLHHGLFPTLRGSARTHVSHREPVTQKLITLFFTTALRETWEEIGLSPLCVRFLGPIPTYRLRLFNRTIFPLAGFVDLVKELRPNREVEKIVEIPLSSFYREDLIGCYVISSPESANSGESESMRFPCLIHWDRDGKKEILWGATFHIITQFLSIVMDYRLPDWTQGCIVRKTLHSDYLTGKPL